MKLRASLAVLAALVVVSALAGCGGMSQAASQAKIVVVDDMHRRIELDRPATRIISLAPSNTEILLALGLRKAIVGVDQDSFEYLPAPYRQEAKGLTDVGNSYSGLNLEAIEAAKPDVILAIPGVDAADLPKLEALKVKIVTLEPQNLAGIYYDILVVGKLAGVVGRAEALVHRMQATIAAVQRAVKGGSHPTVFYELDDSSSGLYTVGPGSFIDSLITLAGGRNAMDPYVKTAYPQVSAEEVVRANPDVIVLGDTPYTTVAAVKARSGWSTVTAVRLGRVYGNIDPSLLQEPGPAVVEGLVLLARDLHPGLVVRTPR
jgi:iron complex transport system substrate-binding protein